MSLIIIRSSKHRCVTVADFWGLVASKVGNLVFNILTMFIMFV